MTKTKKNGLWTPSFVFIFILSVLGVALSLFYLWNIALYVTGEEAAALDSSLGGFIVIAFYYILFHLPIFLLYTIALVIDVATRRRLHRSSVIAILVNGAVFLLIGALFFFGIYDGQLIISSFLALSAAVPGICAVILTYDISRLIVQSKKHSPLSPPKEEA